MRTALLITTLVVAAAGCGLILDTTEKHVTSDAGSAGGDDHDGGCGTLPDGGYPWYPDAATGGNDGGGWLPDGGWGPLPDAGSGGLPDGGWGPLPDAHP